MGLLKERKNIETKDIGVFMIIEAIGRPPEYLAEVLNDIITRIDNEEGVKVLSKKEECWFMALKNFGFRSSFKIVTPFSLSILSKTKDEE